MAIEKFNKYMFIGNFAMLLLNIALMVVALGGFFF